MIYVLLAASPTPAPAPTQTEPWEVSPGLLGFLLGFFVLAIAVVPLFRSMAKHMRRVDQNERLRQAAEEQAASASPDGGAAPPAAKGRRGRVLDAGADGTRPNGTRPDDAGAARAGQSPTD
jgi:hypothetical protein